MEQKKNGMAQASMVLGILSIAGTCCCYGGLILGSLAMILALLSKTEEKLSENARLGLITGAIGLAISVIAVGAVVAVGILDILSHGHTGGLHI